MMPSMKHKSVSGGVWILSRAMLIVCVPGPYAIAGGTIAQVQEAGETSRLIASSCTILR